MISKKSSTQTAMPDAFVVQDLRLSIGTYPILKGISCKIASGKWTCVIGPNGAGKSTLLRSLAGITAGSGSILFGGVDLKKIPRRSLALKLAWLGQNETAIDDLSVYDIVMLGRIPHQSWLASPSQEDKLAVERALSATQSSLWKERTLKQLSAGEKQRVLLSRALAVEADSTLMDEPLINLDLPHQVDWMNQVIAMVKSGKTVVTVLHELSMALHADEIIVMENGLVAHQGPSSQAQTHRAIEKVFHHRIRISSITTNAKSKKKEWVVLPVK
jgi:iron complex transport system ATP-binding protein